MLDRMERDLSPNTRALYVEDNLANVELMKRLFMERPLLELLIATDGASARELARTAVPQLIFVDLNLPDMSGEDLIVHLRNDLREATPPIVVLSADAMSNTIERLKSLGIVEYLTKPYDVQHLFDVIDTFCLTIDRTRA
jgi:CheY-like chemotaxis protein